jgi:hypothetical protein
VTNPLTGDEDGDFDVELELDHLQRGGMVVPHKVADQHLVVPGGLGPAFVTAAGCFGDGVISGFFVVGDTAGHTINQPDKAVVQNINRRFTIGVFQ